MAALEQLIIEATSESNTSDDWAKIIAICEKADSSEASARDAVAALARRISHKNVNVVLFSLTIANSLLQTCSIVVKREIASRPFLDTLVRQISNTTGVRKVIRNRVLELIRTWAEEVRGNESLGYMVHVYERLKDEGVEFPPPNDRPATPKRNNDKDREEEELQLALTHRVDSTNQLALSLSEHEKMSRIQNSHPKSGHAPKPAQILFRVKALYDFHGTEEGELHLTRNDIIEVYDCTTFVDWWKGSCRGVVGIFPSNYVEKITGAGNEKSGEETNDLESMVMSKRGLIIDFQQRVGRVDTRSVGHGEVDRLQSDYQRILEVRPNVIQLASGYRQKQDELTILNERFVKAQAAFHALMQSHAQYMHQSHMNAAPSYAQHVMPPGMVHGGGPYPMPPGPPPAVSGPVPGYPQYAYGVGGQAVPMPMQHGINPHQPAHPVPPGGVTMDPHAHAPVPNGQPYVYGQPQQPPPQNPPYQPGY